MSRRGRARRRLWLARRRRNGRLRPRPLTERLVNAMSVSARAGKARRIFRRALRRAGRYGQPVIIRACEMSKVDAAAEAEKVAPGRFQVIQFGKIGSPESALAIVARKDRVRLWGAKLRPGSPATSEGDGIRERPILTCRATIDHGTPHVWTHDIAVTHAGPPRAPRARAQLLGALKEMLSWLENAAGDLNVTSQAARRILDRVAQGIGVLQYVTAAWIKTSPVEPIALGGDHLAVDRVLWPITKETR